MQIMLLFLNLIIGQPPFCADYFCAVQAPSQGSQHLLTDLNMETQDLNSGLIYSSIPESRYEEVIDYMGANFYTSETICKTIGLFTSGVLPPSFRKVIQSRLQQGRSIYAVHEESQRIVGVVISSLLSEQHEKLLSEAVAELHSQGGEKLGFYVTYMKLLYEGCESIEEFTGRTRIYEIHSVFVSPEFSGRGVGRRLLHEAVVAGKRSNAEVLISIATAPASRKLLEGLGFETLNRVRLREVIVKGQPVTEDSEAASALMVLPNPDLNN